MVARDVRHRFSGAAEALAVWRRLRRGAPRRFGRTATVAAIAATALIAGGAGTYGVTRWTEPSGSPAPVVAVSVPNDRVTDDDEPREHAWDVPDTGIPACDELVRVFLSCDQVPQQARDAFVEAARQWRHALEVGGAAAREAMEQSCAEVVASSDDALRAMGCGSPPPPRIVGEQAETTRPVFAIAGFDDERVTFRYRAGDKLPPAPGSGGIVWFDGDRAPSQFGRGDPDVQLIRAEGHIHVQSSDPGAAIVGLGRGELAQFDRLDPKKLDYQPIGKLELESGNVYLLRLPRTDRHVLFELEIDDPRRHLREKLERDRRQIREPERDEIGDFPPHHRG
jgi:hypothetical protein